MTLSLAFVLAHVLNLTIFLVLAYIAVLGLTLKPTFAFALIMAVILNLVLNLDQTLWPWFCFWLLHSSSSCCSSALYFGLSSGLSSYSS